ncbi:hypothetical protein [Sorangium sp. So ce1151]|uniref:hypothetical protein n=1 Tax=Sorangium sp. So ce1151 TaxID=3133332 RepID=UPI003F5EB2DB
MLKQNGDMAAGIQRLRYQYDLVGNVLGLDNEAPFDERSRGTCRMPRGSGGVVATKHLFAGETRIASKIDADWFQEPPVLYYHPDQLGSTQYVTDQDQQLSQHVEYLPSGELWADQTDSRFQNRQPYLFTGKELDLSTGLYVPDDPARIAWTPTVDYRTYCRADRQSGERRCGPVQCAIQPNGRAGCKLDSDTAEDVALIQQQPYVAMPVQRWTPGTRRLPWIATETGTVRLEGTVVVPGTTSLTLLVQGVHRLLYKQSYVPPSSAGTALPVASRRTGGSSRGRRSAGARSTRGPRTTGERWSHLLIRARGEIWLCRRRQ